MIVLTLKYIWVSLKCHTKEQKNKYVHFIPIVFKKKTHSEFSNNLKKKIFSSVY